MPAASRIAMPRTFRALIAAAAATALLLPVAAARAQDQAPAQAPSQAPSQAEAKSGPTTAPADAYLYIGWPNNGEVVKSPFKVWFGLRNMGVAPAGVQKPGTGHHHLLVDVVELPPADEPIPNNKSHLHFGGGQTEARIELPPGRHTLQLILGDADHVPFDPPVVSKKITVTVR